MLIFLFIFILVSNALTTRRDKSILYSRIVTISFVMTSFIAYNNTYLKPLSKGISLYGGLFNVTSFTHIVSVFILIISAVALTVYLYRKYIPSYSWPASLIVISASLNKIPLYFMTSELGIPLSYVFISAFISVMTITTTSLIHNGKFLSAMSLLCVFLVTSTGGIILMLSNYYDILGGIVLIIGELFPIGFCLATMGPTGSNISNIGNALNSDVGNTNGTGSSASASTTVTGTGTASGSSTRTWTGREHIVAKAKQDNLRNKAWGLAQFVEEAMYHPENYSQEDQDVIKSKGDEFIRCMEELKEHKDLMKQQGMRVLDKFTNKDALLLKIKEDRAFAAATVRMSQAEEVSELITQGKLDEAEALQRVMENNSNTK